MNSTGVGVICLLTTMVVAASAEGGGVSPWIYAAVLSFSAWLGSFMAERRNR